MDLVPPAENGLLPRSELIQVENSKMLEPGGCLEEISDFCY